MSLRSPWSPEPLIPFFQRWTSLPIDDRNELLASPDLLQQVVLSVALCVMRPEVLGQMSLGKLGFLA